MYCCKGKKRKKTERVVLSRRELLYDIENSAYIESQAMDAGDGRRGMVADICQDGNIDRVDRVMALAHSECVDMLYAYSGRAVAPRSEGDDRAECPPEYDILLEVPSDFSVATLYFLTQLVHEYMVCRVMEDWARQTHGEAQAQWRERLVSVGEQIQSCHNRRTGRVRRTLTPW